MSEPRLVVKQRASSKEFVWRLARLDRRSKLGRAVSLENLIKEAREIRILEEEEWEKRQEHRPSSYWDGLGGETASW